MDKEQIDLIADAHYEHVKAAKRVERWSFPDGDARLDELMAAETAAQSAFYKALYTLGRK